MPNDEMFNLKLEQYLLDELSESDKKEIENNPEYMKEIERLKESNNQFFDKFNIQSLAKETEKRTNDRSKVVKFPVKTISSLAAAAACFILIINILPNLNRKQNDEEIIYLKGEQKIRVYLKDNNEIQELNNLNRVKENDQLQITYHSKENYGVIFSLDGLNNITYHYPESLQSTTKLKIGREINLPRSYTLDNAPYFEKFYLITSDKSFNLDLVNSAIQAIEVKDGKITIDIELPGEYKIESITLLKE